MQELVAELNYEAARIARHTADSVARESGVPRFVAGALGPTNRTASLSPDVNDPGMRNITFDELVATYGEASRELLRGGADLILIETIFDTLNAKAALVGASEAIEASGEDIPIIVSGTITDASGRTLSGQTTEAFWNSIRHARPLAVGLNCALGAKQLRPYVEELANLADCYVCAYPERRPAQRLRRVRGDAAGNGGDPGRIRGQRLREPRSAAAAAPRPITSA